MLKCRNVLLLILFNRALYRYVRVLLQIKSYQRKDMSIADIFRQNLAAHPNKPCLIFEDTEWTFAQVNMLRY